MSSDFGFVVEKSFELGHTIKSRLPARFFKKLVDTRQLNLYLFFYPQKLSLKLPESIQSMAVNAKRFYLSSFGFLKDKLFELCSSHFFKFVVWLTIGVHGFKIGWRF